MTRCPYRPFAALACAFAVAALSPTARAQGTMADDFARLQDFSTSPPTLGLALTDMVQWASPNRSYDHTGGAPFPGPRPFYLPNNLWSIHLHDRTTSWQTSNTPRCVKTSREFYVTMVFTDGSRFSFEDIDISEVCSDGSSERFRKRWQLPELGPPGNRGHIIHVESWTNENLATRSAKVRVGAGATAAWTNRNGVPVVSSGPLAIDVAPGGALDLRQNAAASGPIFRTDGPVVVRCDQILMDPGVQPADLFDHPPIVLPAVIVADAVLLSPLGRTHDLGTQFQDTVRVCNLGNAPQTVQVTWSGGFALPGQSSLLLPQSAIVDVSVWFQMPAAPPSGARATTQIQASAPGMQCDAAIDAVFEHQGQFRFGTGTPSNLGPLGVGASGVLAAGGPTVQLATTNADPAAPGLAMFGVPVGYRYDTWNLPGYAVEFYIAPPGPFFLSAFVVADAAGTSTFPVQIPADPGLRGLAIVFQGVHLVTSVQAPYRLCSSPALSLTVQ